MTATLTRPTGQPTPPGRSDGTAQPGSGIPRPERSAAFSARTTAGRTARVWVGLALGLTPLFMIISDTRWYVIGVGATLVAVGPAWLLRLRQHTGPAHVWELLPGVVLLPFYLTAVCVPGGAWGGLVPNGHTWTQVSLLHDELVSTIAGSTAPIDSTPGIQLALAMLLGLAALMVDILCTVLEAPAMVGLVLLPVYVLSGATVREPVNWLWFVLAGAGYLVILSTTGPSSRPWGREMGVRPEGASASLVSGRRIAIVAVLLALAVPFALPGQARTVLSEALRTGSGDGQGGSGTGGVTELASLKGSLSQGAAQNLFRVTVPTALRSEPFYLRQAVLDVYDGTTWRSSADTTTSSAQAPDLPFDPVVPAAVPTVKFPALIAVDRLDGRPPIFANTQHLSGLPDGSAWNRQAGTVVFARVHGDAKYSMQVAQPAPTPEQLAATSDPPPTTVSARYLLPPLGVRQSVAATAAQVTAGASSPYDKARALSQWFTDPANGFSYSLNVPARDNADALSNFLEQKTGFCQQYAAAMAVMLRLVGVPSRVVVGYTHARPDKKGSFTVTTRDAHAWVEAYLGGVGWTSFDPTPLSGPDSARQVIVPWAPQKPTPAASSAPGSGPASAASSSSAAGKQGQGLTANETGTGAVTGNRTSKSLPTWAAGLLVVGLLALLAAVTPTAQRRRVRRRRLRSDDPARARWDELHDVCLDLGLGWSPARSPRRTAAWVSTLGADGGALMPLVRAVEISRYARADAPPDLTALDRSLCDVERSLRALVGRRRRMRARFWPRSVIDQARVTVTRRANLAARSLSALPHKNPLVR